jgi:hypothetical protein
MEEERDAAEEVKRDNPILVILGNPPYNAFAGVSAAAEKILVEPYKEGLISRWGIKKFNLDDLYVRFFGLAERRIAGMTGKGVVSYISNFSYLGDPSFLVMRQRFLTEFDALWFDCLNGDSRETGKLTPEGKPDPSVFSTEYNREGIRIGTAVCLMVRKNIEQPPSAVPLRGINSVRFRHFWGVTKRADLLESLDAPDFEAQYKPVNPEKSNRFSFRPSEVAAHYLEWPKLTDLCSEPPIQGMDEDRANSLISLDRNDLSILMRQYFDKNVSWDQFVLLGTGLSRKSAAFEPKNIREKAQKEDEFVASNIRRYLFRPYDNRWCYYSSVPNVWKRSRPELFKQCWEGNTFLLTRPAGVSSPEGIPIFSSRNLMARDCMKGHAIAFPIRLMPLYATNANRNNKQNNFFTVHCSSISRSERL